KLRDDVKHQRPTDAVERKALPEFGHEQHPERPGMTHDLPELGYPVSVGRVCGSTHAASPIRSLYGQSIACNWRRGPCQSSFAQPRLARGEELRGRWLSVDFEIPRQYQRRRCRISMEPRSRLCQRTWQVLRAVGTVGGNTMDQTRLRPADIAATILAAVLLTEGAVAAPTTLIDDAVVEALASELSGDSARRTLDVISGSHRMRASRGFDEAAQFVAARLRDYGLEDVEVMQFAADGRTMFGTQRSRPAWDVDAAELWELQSENGQWRRSARVADWNSTPLSLAQDSESGDVTTALIDVGSGTDERDYAGKDVRGNLVLVSSQPEDVQALAVDRHGAAGIVSYAQNQRTAWWGEDASLLRWGHLRTFSATPAFAFMITPQQARAWQARLAEGNPIQLEAHVQARRHEGHYEIVTARIRGADPRLADQEIAFSCHLDHPHPGANDNASGCATILEVARTYAKLIREGRLARPARSLRFLWPPEIEGSTILLNARPDLARRFVAVVHMDMVGGGPETKAVFHVTESPASLPTFVSDVAKSFGEFVNEQSLAHASGESARYPLVELDGGKEPLLAQMSEFSNGSDNEVFTEGSFRIPTIYLNDWPDRYIHTNRDVPENIDPTKLKRAAFIGAASAWYLANVDTGKADGLVSLLERGQLDRTSRMLARRARLSAEDAAATTRFHWEYERGVIDSIGRFVQLTPVQRGTLEARLALLERAYGSGGKPLPVTGEAARVYRRNPEPKGPMAVFGYDYLADRLGDERARGLQLLDYSTSDGFSAAYALEALNFVDGRRNVQDIRDALTATFGPVPIGYVAEYLQALEQVGVLRH
ncbi:MAG TPA: M28 family peptidase, partial [Steroidobacteraceae bacterium]